MGTYLQPSNVHEGGMNKPAAIHDKTDVEIKRDIAMIRAWLAKQIHLPKDQDDKFLENMLRRSKFSLQLTKSKLDIYYLLRSTYPDFCLNNPFEPALVENRKHFCAIPITLTKKNERVFVLTLSESADEFHMKTYVRNAFSTWEVLLHQDDQAAEIFVMDFRNWTFSHTKKLILSEFLITAKLGFDLYFAHLNRAEVLCDSSSIGALIRLFKVVFPMKYQETLHLHTTLESLHECVPKSQLPLELGGDLESIKVFHEKHEAFLAKNRNFFLEQSTKISNEELRKEFALDSEYFGIDGSYKQHEMI